jgi:hypothetical protein
VAAFVERDVMGGAMLLLRLSLIDEGDGTAAMLLLELVGV